MPNPATSDQPLPISGRFPTPRLETAALNSLPASLEVVRPTQPRIKPSWLTGEFWLLVGAVALINRDAWLGLLPGTWAAGLTAFLAVAFKIGRQIYKLRMAQIHAERLLGSPMLLGEMAAPKTSLDDPAIRAAMTNSGDERGCASSDVLAVVAGVGVAVLILGMAWSLCHPTLAGRETRLIANPAKVSRTCGEEQLANKPTPENAKPNKAATPLPEPTPPAASGAPAGRPLFRAAPPELRAAPEPTPRVRLRVEI